MLLGDAAALSVKVSVSAARVSDSRDGRASGWTYGIGDAGGKDEDNDDGEAGREESLESRLERLESVAKELDWEDAAMREEAEQRGWRADEKVTCGKRGESPAVRGRERV